MGSREFVLVLYKRKSIINLILYIVGHCRFISLKMLSKRFLRIQIFDHINHVEGVNLDHKTI